MGGASGLALELDVMLVGVGFHASIIFPLKVREIVGVVAPGVGGFAFFRQLNDLKEFLGGGWGSGMGADGHGGLADSAMGGGYW